jgi:hypothetical protein
MLFAWWFDNPAKPGDEQRSPEGQKTQQKP